MANKADNQIKWVLNKMPKSDDKQVANMSQMCIRDRKKR